MKNLTITQQSAIYYVQLLEFRAACQMIPKGVIIHKAFEINNRGHIKVHFFEVSGISESLGKKDEGVNDLHEVKSLVVEGNLLLSRDGHINTLKRGEIHATE
jgi:hypothetical protein